MKLLKLEINPDMNNFPGPFPPINREEGQTALNEMYSRSIVLPRYQAGQMEWQGWKIDYVDALALISSLDILVLKGWNNFTSSRPDPVILDCGANIGISVLNYKRHFPQAKITAFEPDPQFIPYLKKNLEQNHAADVQIVEAAVWKEEGTTTFLCEGADGSKIITEASPSARTVTVRTIELAKYITGEIDLIKVDIEGAEYDVLPSISSKLHLVKNMIVECHLYHRDLHGFARLLDTLTFAGFKVSLNSFGRWCDLVQRPETPSNEFNQYMLVCAWKD